MNSVQKKDTIITLLTKGQTVLKIPYLIKQWDVSEQEYLELMNEDLAVELIDEVLIIHSPASYEHEKIFSFLLVLLDTYTREKQLGEVLGSRFVMRLSSTTYFEPDLMFVPLQDRAKIKETMLEGLAPFVIEIPSPSTRELDLNQKIPLYLENGVQEVWIVDPETKKLYQYLAGKDKTPRSYTTNDKVTCQTIKGFWLRVSWLWPIENEEKAPLDCLKMILE